MDAKELNELVHDREAAFYDDRFLISYGPEVGRALAREMAKLTGPPMRAGRALDFACGTGFGAIGLVEAGLADEVHGFDLSAAMVERARQNAGERRIELARADGEYLPYRDGSFDLIVARGALHHLPAPVEALREMRRVMAPGGVTIVLAEPTPSGEAQVGAVVGSVVKAVEAVRRLLGRQADPVHHHWELASIAANLHTFRPNDLAGLAIKAGFSDVTVQTAALAWVLALGINYYLVGEFPLLARLPGRAAVVEGAAAFDRAVSDRFLPGNWRHTVQAVLR